MREALTERSATDDPKGKIVPQSAVGSIVADREGEIARSANVLPPIFRDLFDKGARHVSDAERYHFIEHAERAAIFKALRSRSDLSSATIYCTRFPCSDCARAILFSGIKRAVFLGGFAGEKRWLASQRAALSILRDGGVVVRYMRAHGKPAT
jgi:deoxycytidylate deaminase